MNALQEMQEKYDTGMPTFLKLFALNRTELKAKLFELCGDKIANEYILKDGSVEKTITNDVPEEIKIYFYDVISITPFGIKLKLEHYPEYNIIIAFDNHFTL